MAKFGFWALALLAVSLLASPAAAQSAPQRYLLYGGVCKLYLGRPNEFICSDVAGSPINQYKACVAYLSKPVVNNNGTPDMNSNDWVMKCVHAGSKSPDQTQNCMMSTDKQGVPRQFGVKPCWSY